MVFRSPARSAGHARAAGLRRDGVRRPGRLLNVLPEGSPTLKPILRPYDTVGTTRYVDFHTIRETYKTRADKCHVSHVAGDSGWEFKLAQELEDMPEVIAYVKNQSLGFTIPYSINNVERQAAVHERVTGLEETADGLVFKVQGARGDYPSQNTGRVTVAIEKGVNQGQGD